ncbi:SEC-C metal-binding domain-containing protein [Mailhella massiliensis]
MRRVEPGEMEGAEGAEGGESPEGTEQSAGTAAEEASPADNAPEAAQEEVKEEAAPEAPAKEPEAKAEPALNLRHKTDPAAMGGPAPAKEEDRRTYNGVKVGRNDPCPCGSGKKFKKCCGRNL